MVVRIRERNRMPALLAALAELDRTRIEVGVFGAAESHLLMIARVHEFGARIEVTPKMRGWFRGQGHPLRRETTQITIPERSYMRSSWDESAGELERLTTQLLRQVLTLRLSPAQMYERIGVWLVGRIQRQIRTLSEPPLHPMTVERKGSSNPLVDTGRLIQSITYRVVKG